MASLIRLVGRFVSLLNNCLVSYKQHKINVLLGGVNVLFGILLIFQAWRIL